jgi:hypothetical protein
VIDMYGDGVKCPAESVQKSWMDFAVVNPPVVDESCRACTWFPTAGNLLRVKLLTSESDMPYTRPVTSFAISGHYLNKHASHVKLTTLLDKMASQIFCPGIQYRI